MAHVEIELLSYPDLFDFILLNKPIACLKMTQLKFIFLVLIFFIAILIFIMIQSIKKYFL